MLKIKLADNTEFAYLDALETEEFFNGASRRTLTFACEANAIGLDALNQKLTESNLANIQLSDTESGVQNIYDGYVLKLFCGIKSTLIQPESPDAPAVYEDRLSFKLRKRTYIEQQLQNLGIH